MSSDHSEPTLTGVCLILDRRCGCDILTILFDVYYVLGLVISKSVKQTEIGDMIRISVSDGTIGATVIEVKENAL